jgi:hypothetical protein
MLGYVLEFDWYFTSHAICEVAPLNLLLPCHEQEVFMHAHFTLPVFRIRLICAEQILFPWLQLYLTICKVQAHKILNVAEQCEGSFLFFEFRLHYGVVAQD